MSLLPNRKRYTRPQPDLTLSSTPPNTLLNVLEAEESHLAKQLQEIEEAKSREQNLRNRLSIVQQSLQAFRALEAASEPVQEQSAPAPIVKNVRKAATRKTARPTQSSIAQEPVVSDTENIALVHDDFSTFPE